MVNYDVEFIVNSGVYQGKRYRFTLATIDGAKVWNRTRVFYPPPSMRKERIDMSIEARENNINTSGSVELRPVDEVIDQIVNMANETEPSTLKGIDGSERLVQIDRDGFNVSSTINESTREPEYKINLTCWVLY